MHSLKIEGRTKSHYYVARTAQVYRQAIDDAAAGKPFDRGLMDTLESSPTAATPRASCAATCTTSTRTTSTAIRCPSASSSSANSPANAATNGPRWEVKNASNAATASNR